VHRIYPGSEFTKAAPSDGLSRISSALIKTCSMARTIHYTHRRDTHSRLPNLCEFCDSMARRDQHSFLRTGIVILILPATIRRDQGNRIFAIAEAHGHAVPLNGF